MKKYFVLFLALMIITGFNYAQLIRGYGIKVGTTISKQDWEFGGSLPNKDFQKTGFNAGVFAEFLNVPFVSIVTELNYVQKGLKSDLPVTTATNPDGTGEKLEGSINYFNITALGKLRYNLGILNPYIAAGPKMDFELNRNSTLKDMQDIKKNRFGVKVGLGTEIVLPSFNLLAEFIYDTDFSELTDTQGLKIKTRSYDLRIGISF